MTVTAWFSRGARHRRYHLDPSCTGLGRVVVHNPAVLDEPDRCGCGAGPRVVFAGDDRPARFLPGAVCACEVDRLAGCQLAVTDAADLVSLGERRDGRMCRLCGLEAVADAALRLDGPRVLVTFTGQERPADGAVLKPASETGRDRLRRIAGRAGLDVVDTIAGPAAYGLVPVRAVAVLAANLRCVAHHDATAVPERLVIACWWALLEENPPAEAAAVELFDLARLAAAR